MCVLGAIFTENVSVQQLTDFIWTGADAYEDRVLESIARLFRALHIGLQSLKGFYATLTISQPGITQPLFPFIRSCPDPNGHQLNFRYLERLNQTKALYLARDDTGRKLIVKFVKRYNSLAHQLLARHGLAPTLYYSARDRAENARPLGLEIVVMDFVEGTNAHDLFPTGRLPESKFGFVEKAMNILHAQSIVFGDLRLPNIIITDKGKPILIDFDWCGEDNSARYPPDLNDTAEIRWHSGVARNSLMSIEHDRFMLDAMSPDPSRSMDLSQ
jgi:serine/threonine protein kinase